MRIAREPELISALAESFADSPTNLGHIWDEVRRAIALGPARPDLQFHAARLALRLGLKNDAAALLADALALNPRYLDALILYGEVITALARPDEGSATLQRAIAGGADYPDVHLRLGHALRAQGKPQEAAAAYRRALQMNQRLAAAREALRALTEEEGKGAQHELSA